MDCQKEEFLLNTCTVPNKGDIFIPHFIGVETQGVLSSQVRSNCTASKWQSQCLACALGATKIFEMVDQHYDFIVNFFFHK
jgi:hypothetical protein